MRDEEARGAGSNLQGTQAQHVSSHIALQNGYYSRNISSSNFWGKKIGKKGGNGGEIRKRKKTKKNVAEIRLFTTTIQMIQESSRTDPYSLIFGHIKVLHVFNVF